MSKTSSIIMRAGVLLFSTIIVQWLLRFDFNRIIGVLSLSSPLAKRNNNQATSSSTGSSAMDRRSWFLQTIMVTLPVSAAVVADPSPVWAAQEQSDDAIATTSSTLMNPQRKSSTTPYLMEEYFQQGTTAPTAGRFYFPTLTPPFINRATYLYELGRNSWALEQLLTFANVTATIRTNVVLLEKQNGGLWVHSPQWPTGEFCQLLESIGHPVKHVVLPCNALEHKAPMQAFCKKYPNATVWISPGQYGPFGKCGMDLEQGCNMGYKVDGIFSLNNHNKNQGQGGSEIMTTTRTSTLPPWADEFDICTLYASLPENAGPVSEVAFCHRPTKTLIVTDAVVFVPPMAPPIFGTYFDSSVVNNKDFWPKTVLQSVFLPLRQSANGRWPGYDALENRLVRAPILRAFADARAPDTVREWIMEISQNFYFDRILTSHFASPIAATPKNFADAFSYLMDENDNALLKRSSYSLDGSSLPPIACRDWELLDALNQGIEQNKLGAPVVFDFQKGCVAD